MGWYMTLHSNKEIPYEKASEIVFNLPKSLRGYWEEMNYQIKDNGWGWNAGCDIYRPENLSWKIGGSYGGKNTGPIKIGFDVAEDMANHLKQELEKNGHVVRIEVRR